MNLNQVETDDRGKAEVRKAPHQKRANSSAVLAWVSIEMSDVRPALPRDVRKVCDLPEAVIRIKGLRPKLGIAPK
jgi:hypothetical protein